MSQFPSADANPANWLQAYINVTGTAVAELLPAQGAGLRNNIRTLSISNGGSVAQDVTIISNPGSAEVVLAVFKSPAGGGFVPPTYENPLRGGVNVNIGVVCSPAGSQHITATGFKAP